MRKRAIFLSLLILTLFVGCERTNTTDTLTEQGIPIESITVYDPTDSTAASSTVGIGRSLTLVAEVLPSDAEDQTVIWGIESGTAATIDTITGNITGVSEGIVKVKAEATNADGSSVVSNSYEVKVIPVSVTGITISDPTDSTATSGTVGLRRSLVLTAEVLPVDATNSDVIWSIASGNAASIDATTGEVTGVSEGSARIQATAADGSGVAAIYDVEIVQLPFVLTYNIPVGGLEGANALKLPLRTSGADMYDLTIDWGDPANEGVVTTVTEGSQAEYVYANDTGSAYTVNVSITGDLQFGDTDSDGTDDGSFGGGAYSVHGEHLIGIKSFGSVEFINNVNTFIGIKQNITLPDEQVDTPYVKGNAAQMFSGAELFNQDISHWDMSGVTDMMQMFSGARAFSQDLSDWNVSSLKSTQAMFAGSVFNGGLNWQNTGSLENTNYMFASNSTFNQDISSWDMSNVTSMTAMFNQATAFNQNISNWELTSISSVSAMDALFSGASNFNQDMSSWENWRKRTNVNYTNWLLPTKMSNDNKVSYLPPDFSDFSGN